MSSSNSRLVWDNLKKLKNIGFKCQVVTFAFFIIGSYMLKNIGFKCQVVTKDEESYSQSMLKNIGFKCQVVTQNHGVLVNFS